MQPTFFSRWILHVAMKDNLFGDWISIFPVEPDPPNNDIWWRILPLLQLSLLSIFFSLLVFGVVPIAASNDSLSVILSLALVHLNSSLKLKIGNFKMLFP